MGRTGKEVEDKKQTREDKTEEHSESFINVGTLVTKNGRRHNTGPEMNKKAGKFPMQRRDQRRGSRGRRISVEGTKENKNQQSKETQMNIMKMMQTKGRWGGADRMQRHTDVGNEIAKRLNGGTE